MIVGIDLGTTNSLVAAFTEEGPVIIPNRLGKHLTPLWSAWMRTTMSMWGDGTGTQKPLSRQCGAGI